MISTACVNAMDLLEKTLRFNPASRCAVDEMLAHQYLYQLHCPDDEPTRTPIDLSEFEFERRKINLSALREEIFIEAVRYHPHIRDQLFADQLVQGNIYCVTDYRLLEPG